MDECDFGRHLVIARLRRGLTQVELAQVTGLSARCISDLERGINAAPRLATLHRLIDGLDLNQRDARVLREAATCSRVRLRFGEDVPPRDRRGRRWQASTIG